MRNLTPRRFWEGTVCIQRYIWVSGGIEGLSSHLRECPGQALLYTGRAACYGSFQISKHVGDGAAGTQDRKFILWRTVYESAGWGLRGSPSLFYSSCCGCACPVRHQSLTQGTSCACQNCCPVSAPHCCDADGPSQPLVFELVNTQAYSGLLTLGPAVVPWAEYCFSQCICA